MDIKPSIAGKPCVYILLLLLLIIVIMLIIEIVYMYCVHISMHFIIQLFTVIYSIWIYWEKGNSWKAYFDFLFKDSDTMKTWIGLGDHCTDTLRLSKSNSESRMEVVNWPLDDSGRLLASGESHAHVPAMCVRDKWCFTDVCLASSLVVYTAKAFSVLASTT